MAFYNTIIPLKHWAKFEDEVSITLGKKGILK
jgi:hypothetical protein